MFVENLLKNPIIEGYERISFKTHGSIVAFTNQYGLVGSVYSVDLAEAFKYDKSIVKELPKAGTVMVFNKDNGLVIPAHDELEYGQYYAGVIRYNPGIFLGAKFNDWEELFKQGYLPLAIIGQVDVLVNNNYEYKIGTKLVSDISGKARPLLYRDKDEWFGKVIEIIDNNKVKALIK